MPLTYKTYALNEAAVDAVSADLQAYLNKLNMEGNHIQRIRLTVEEMILSLLGFSILFGSLGIPMDALILAAAIDIIMDFIDTGFNVMLLIFRITAEAGRQGVLEREALLRQD